MPDQTLSLLFYRGNGIAFWLVRLGCWQPLGDAFGLIPGHAAVRIGGSVYEAVSKGVRRECYSAAAGRSDLLREIVMPARTDAQIAAALIYAESCLGERYSWHDIAITAFQFLAPIVAARYPKAFRQSKRGTICSLFALLTVATAGCRIHPCISPATTPAELMERAEDYVFALDTEGAAPTTDCKCSSTEETQ